MDTGPSVWRAGSEAVDYRLAGPGSRDPRQCAPFHALTSFFCYSLDNALQLTVVCGNWRASAKCSSRSSYYAHAPRLLSDTHTRVRSYPLGPLPIGTLLSNVRHALWLANIAADSRYMLFAEFSGENGRRLKEYLGAGTWRVGSFRIV